MPPEPTNARRIVVLLCLAEVLSMTGFAAYPAFLPALRTAWGMSGAEAGFIGGAFFFGYMLAVPLLSGITDRINARGVFAVSCLLAAAGTAGFALLAQDVASAALCQALAGAGRAGFSASWPWWLMLATLAGYFTSVMADSAALTAGLVAATPLAQRGAAMALYSLLGFGAGFVAPLVFGATLDAAGNDATAWVLAFGTLGSGGWVWALTARRRVSGL